MVSSSREAITRRPRRCPVGSLQTSKKEALQHGRIDDQASDGNDSAYADPLIKVKVFYRIGLQIWIDGDLRARRRTPSPHRCRANAVSDAVSAPAARIAKNAGLWRIEQPCGFVVGGGEDDLDRLIRQPQHVGGVARARVAGSLRAADHRGAKVSWQPFMSASVKRYPRNAGRHTRGSARSRFILEHEQNARHAAIRAAYCRPPYNLTKPPSEFTNDSRITMAQYNKCSPSATEKPCYFVLLAYAVRGFYGTSIFSATAWDADSVRIEDGAGRTFRHPEKQLAKTFCDVCGEIVFGTNRLGMRVVPNALVTRETDGKLDAALAPTMHLFYRQRVIDVSDDLPKYLDGWDGPTYASQQVIGGSAQDAGSKSWNRPVLQP
ncbi:hypothetical protein Dimus_034989 [Dionaea muscipula]